MFDDVLLTQAILEGSEDVGLEIRVKQKGLTHEGSRLDYS